MMIHRRLFFDNQEFRDLGIKDFNLFK